MLSFIIICSDDLCFAMAKLARVNWFMYWLSNSRPFSFKSPVKRQHIQKRFHVYVETSSIFFFFFNNSLFV